MEVQFYISLLISITITSLLWYIYVTKLKGEFSTLKNNHQNLNMNLDKEIIVKDDEKYKLLQNKLSEAHLNINQIKHESYLEGYEKAKKEFSIKIYPYKREKKRGDDGFLINDIFHEVTLGYQYQLFVNGIPLLQPAVIIEEKLTQQKKEVDYNKVNKVMEMIESKLLPIVADSKGLIKLIKTTK